MYMYFEKEEPLFLPKFDSGTVNTYSCCLQVVNGLMEREDWETAIKVPIGMLPTGSGNALVASTLDESG